MVNTASGAVMRTSPALEGPASTVVGAARVNVNGRTMAVDAAGTTAYALTTSGLSIIPLDVQSQTDRPQVNPNGTVSLSSYVPAFAPGSLVSIFGRNLGTPESFSGNSAPPVLGGVCVTLNNQPMPLLMTSADQINAQIPTDLTPGRYPLVVRSLDRKVAAIGQTVQVTRYAPAIFTDPETQEVLLFRQDGSRVTRDAPARRDERLMMFATGLGATTGARIAPGQPSPASPLAETDPAEVFFGDSRYRQAEVIVDWAGLTPGFIGLYQINLRVPGDHMRGERLPVLLRIGGAESQKTGPVVPVVAVQ
jgi:uncharacterized protein (TIGR03437 family)